LLRYALLIFPWLAICAAMNIDAVFRSFQIRKGSVYSIILLFTGLVYLFSTRLPLIVRIYDNMPQRFPINYLMGRETRDEFLSRNLAVYDAYQFIDGQENGPQRVLSIGNEFRLYTQSRIDGIYDVAKTHKIISSAKSIDELSNSLDQLGYDYILVNQAEVNSIPWKYKDPYPILQDSKFLNTYGNLVFVQNGIYVYRFVPAGVQLPKAINLITNAGFETLVGENDFEGWVEEGAIELSDEAYQGENALLLNAPSSPKGNGYVYQQIAVEEDQIYTLGYWINANQQATFLMQIRWLDENGNLISVEENWENVTPDWGWYSLHSQAPQGARFAKVFASLGGAENVLVDDICLAKGQRCPEEP